MIRIAHRLTQQEFAPHSARLAGLRYSKNHEPGYRRQMRGKKVQYVDQAGRIVRNPQKLARFAALAIPPAWTEVWICKSEQGHLQATGRDARGRKQYRYHPQWRTTRDQLKYERIITFAQRLPRIRRRVDRDLRLPGLPREKVLAAVVRLLDCTHIRVGGEQYERDNGSYGLATIKDRHVAVRGPHMLIRFRGKLGKQREVQLNDARLAKIVRQCRDLPGQDLFQYQDEQRAVRDVTSLDVNDYLREISGDSFTAKDFRTWVATTLAIDSLLNCLETASQAAAKRNVNAALDVAAEQLGNTRAVCRKSYVHPGVLQAYLDGTLGQPRRAGRTAGLLASEARALAVLKRLSTVTNQQSGKRRASTGPKDLKQALVRSIKLKTRESNRRRVRAAS